MNISEYSIKTKKTIFIVTAVILFACIAAALAMFTYRNSTRINLQNQEYLIDNTIQIASNIDSSISHGYDSIKVLSALVSSTLTSPDFDISGLQSLINNSIFDFMEFADKDGYDHNITGGVSDARDRQYYLDAKAGYTGMELIYESRATHETLLMFYSPVYFENQFAGSLVGVYQASNKITELLTNNFFGESTEAYLVTESGRIIASSGYYDPHSERYVQDLAGGNTEAREIIEKALTTGRTSTFSLENNPSGGCIVKLPKHGWFVVQMFPPAVSSRMISNANNLGYQLVSFLIAIYIALIAVIVIFYRNQRRQVEKARIQAEVASMAKTNFLFNMSHDIRTPMNAILGYTDIALRHIKDPDRVTDSLKKIKSSGSHLLNLINDILEMSRIESGKMELTSSPLDIRSSIDIVSQMSKALAIPKSIDFTTIVGDIKNPYLSADELHINEIVINLISNAIKYTDQGGKVEYRVEQTGDAEDGVATFRFTIKDTGIGMSDEFQEKLFESFTRENNSTVSRQEGTGLGLAIVRKIIDMAGGTIHVVSKKGEGSTFTVELPLEVLDEQRMNEFIDSQNKASEKIIADTDLKGKRILICEDNFLNREITTDILTESGFEIESAEDGQIALDMIKQNGTGYYDFVLMDIQMPIMNGYEATAEIRKLPGGELIPIIALSANAFKEDIAKSLESGMNAHVAKPIDVDQLISTLQTLSRQPEDRS